LDVYLELDSPAKREHGSGIFIRRDGSAVEISRSEWDAANPGREPVVLLEDETEDTCVYHANITHNLGRMAREAGIYECLWRPEEIRVTHAKQLISMLRVGLDMLIAQPNHMKQFNPENGWGDYDGFKSFVGRYLEACEEWPDATVRVSR